MSDAVIVSIVGGIALVLSRWSSHREHAKTAKVVEEIHVMVNGNLERVREQLAAANQRIEHLEYELEKVEKGKKT